MQEELMLTKNRQNIVHRLVEGAQLNPRDFEWQGRRSRHTRHTHPEPFVSVLVHKPTGSFFMFDHSDSSAGSQEFVSVVSPGIDRREEVFRASDWDTQMHDVIQWLDRLRSELQEPDLWQVVTETSRHSHLKLPPKIASSVFTSEEQEQVRRKLSEIEKSIADLRALSDQQFQVLHEKLNEIADAAKELKRGQWYHFAVGEIVQFSLDAAVKSDALGKVFHVLQSAFQYLVNLPPVLPPPIA